jgi:hypothetical protein
MVRGGVREVARLTGGGRAVPGAAALIAAVIPSALLVASSTQNDLFAAALGLGLVPLMLGWEPLGRPVAPAVLLGAGVGLALLGKGIIAPLLGPLLLLLAGRVVVLEQRRSSWAAVGRRAGIVAVVAVLAALVVVGPFVQRNREVFGTFDGPVSRYTQTSSVTPQGTASNLLRGVAVHYRIGDGGDDPASLTSRYVLGGLRRLHDWTGADPNDPATTLIPSDVFASGDHSELERAEDYGADPWHVALILVAMVVLGVEVLRGRDGARLPLLVGAGLTAGFIVFVAATRWSLYVPRYHLPLLVLWAPVIAVALAGLHRFVLRGAVVLLVLAGVPQLVDNVARPLFDGPDTSTDLSPYFAPRPEGEGVPFVPAADYERLRDLLVATGCDHVGIGNWVVFEYPLWVALDEAGWTGRIEHVDVDNPTAGLATDGVEPCATVRQQLWFPPLEPLAGQGDLAVGGLVLSLPPEVAERLPADLSG